MSHIVPHKLVIVPRLVCLMVVRSPYWYSTRCEATAPSIGSFGRRL